MAWSPQVPKEILFTKMMSPGYFITIAVFNVLIVLGILCAPYENDARLGNIQEMNSSNTHNCNVPRSFPAYLIIVKWAGKDFDPDSSKQCFPGGSRDGEMRL